jgi:hypothetical protein
VIVAVASSVARCLAASLIASCDSVAQVVALSVRGAFVCVRYGDRPKAGVRRAVLIGLRRGGLYVADQPIVDTPMLERLHLRVVAEKIARSFAGLPAFADSCWLGRLFADGWRMDRRSSIVRAINPMCEGEPGLSYLSRTATGSPEPLYAQDSTLENEATCEVAQSLRQGGSYQGLPICPSS